MAAPIHLSLGWSALPSTLAATTKSPAARRTWRSRSHVWRPRLTGAPGLLPAVHAAVKDVQAGQPGLVQCLFGLGGAGT